MSTVLFVSHNADRSGAVILLLRLLRWLRRNSEMQLEVALLVDGPLRSEFAQVATVHLVSDWWRPGSLPARLLRRAGREVRYRFCPSSTAAVVARDVYNLVYFNSIASCRVLNGRFRPGVPVLTHVHELESAYQNEEPRLLRALFESTTRFIVPSTVAKDTLHSHWPSAAGRVAVIPGFVSSATPDQSDAPRFRESLGIPRHAIVVGGSGRRELTKGTDLFLRLAALVLAYPLPVPVHFVWLGGSCDSELFRWIERDMKRLNLMNSVHFVPHVANPESCQAAFDLFAMTSREESFSLVDLEAAMHGVPIVCFADAGGAPEFVNADAGYVVPYLDLGSMAARVVDLVHNSALRLALGRRAAEKVQQGYTADHVAPRILEQIELLLTTCPSALH